ncbi:DUF2933 domain-containing protein [Noviherbaspirillum aerium]|uniref:DUF2933 domain-containing protein n=1 Tax=Noviherbaspirillum aerium TaxID=2588497 RepID=UPI00298FE87C|nr:DUF2933 domain-containing protein [Noviherbaspirillum aerium]
MLAVATYFLWIEHRSHVMSVLPYLLLVACPPVHIFHHHGHGEHHGSGRRRAGTGKVSYRKQASGFIPTFGQKNNGSNPQ